MYKCRYPGCSAELWLSRSFAAHAYSHVREVELEPYREIIEKMRADVPRKTLITITMPPKLKFVIGKPPEDKGTRRVSFADSVSNVFFTTTDMPVTSPTEVSLYSSIIPQPISFPWKWLSHVQPVLKVELDTSSGEGEYHCDICGRVFRHTRHLDRHIRKHRSMQEYEDQSQRQLADDDDPAAGVSKKKIKPVRPGPKPTLQASIDGTDTNIMDVVPLERKIALDPPPVTSLYNSNDVFLPNIMCNDYM